MDISPQHLLLSIILGVALGAWTSYLAKLRGRDPRIWFLLGFSFGILGLIVLLVLPDLTKKDKKEEVGAVIEPLIKDAEYKDWFYLDEENNQQGPVTFSNLQEIFENKKISSISYVWSEGMEEWKTIEECQLFTS